MSGMSPDLYLRFMHKFTADVLEDFNPTNTPLSKLPVIDFWTSNWDPRELNDRPDYHDWVVKNGFDAFLPPFSACWVKVMDHCALVRANRDFLQFLICGKMAFDKINGGRLALFNVKGMGYPFISCALSQVERDTLNDSWRYTITNGVADLFMSFDDQECKDVLRKYQIPESCLPGIKENMEINLSENMTQDFLDEWYALSNCVMAALAVTNYLLSRRSIEKAEKKCVVIPDAVKLFEDDRQEQKRIIKNLKEYSFEHVTILSTDPPKRVTERNIDKLYAREPYQIHTPAWLVSEHTRAPARAHERHLKDGRVIQVREGSHTATVSAHVNQHKGIETPKPDVAEFRETLQVWEGRGY